MGQFYDHGERDKKDISFIGIQKTKHLVIWIFIKWNVLDYGVISILKLVYQKYILHFTI